MARSRSSAASAGGSGTGVTGSLSTNRPCGRRMRYTSASARRSSASRKTLKRQFCAGTPPRASLAAGYVDDPSAEPPVHARRGGEIRQGSRPHLRDGLDADDGTGPAAEVRELQKLETATDTHVQDGRLVHEIPRMDRRAAA